MAGQLGWSPSDFWQSTYAELHYMYKGYLKANGIDPDHQKQSMTLEEYERLKAQYPDE